MKKRLMSIMLVILAGMIALVGCQKEETDMNLIKNKYAEYFSVGVATGAETMTLYEGGDKDLISHFNSMTAENEMKWASLQATENSFNFKLADEQIEFAQRNDMEVRGHALVWYQSSPAWLFVDGDKQASKELILDRIRTHVDTVSKHFADDVYVWDVVNEVIADSGDDTYRTNENFPLYEITGTDFISEAFIQARKSLDEVGATDVKLYYNDYSMTDPVKRAKCIEMLTMLIEDGVPIDGIGMQAHYNIWNFNVDEFALAIDQFVELGLEVSITELDFDVYMSQSDAEYEVFPEKIDELLGTCYKQVFEVCREKSEHIANLTMWAVADDYTWLDKPPGVSVTRKNYPMLFDIFHEPKSAFDKIMNF